jgi:hypothetical protein
MGVGGRVGGLALVVGGAIVVYFGVCWLLGLRPAAMHPTRSGGGR